MKKYFYTLIFACLINASVFAQAVLPTSWNFATTTLPTGWTSSGAFNYYPGSGKPAPAGKFQSTGDLLTIFFSSTPGTLKYDIVGNPQPGGVWGGTFKVEESVNGSSWTTVVTYTTLSTAYTTFTHVLNGASRYARFNFTTHVSGNPGGNVGLDNVSITSGVSPNPEIIVKQGTTTITNGGSYTTGSPVATTTPITFSIYNLGLAALNISAITITGPDAGDFVLGTFPTSVAGTSNANFNLDFTPSIAGTRIATMIIGNNDANANPYIINLNCVGGNLATEPIAQPTSLTFPIVKSYRIKGSFVAPVNAPTGYLILKRTGTAVTDAPLDGVVYQRGDVIGSSTVIASTASTNFLPSTIIANTTYHYAIFTYNGTGTFRNYLTTAPLTGNVTSSNSMQPGTYYNSVNTSNGTFVTDLHNKINTHTMQFYGSYGQLMVTQFMARDTTNGQRVLTCAYSGQNKIYTEPWDWTSNNFSREHTYCHNWMATNPADALPEYNDYHHLFPTNQNDANALRSNYPLGEVVTPTYTYLGCKYGKNAQGKTVFEPRDSDKGDAARGMMYMTVCYTGVSGNLWALPSNISSSIPYGQDQNVLKKWHYQDPPDNFEIARNDYVDSLQGNRNPFIDSVQYVCYIDFRTMTKINSPLLPCNNSAVGIDNFEKGKDIVLIAPNPNQGDFAINYITNKNKNVTVRMFDGVGRVVYTKQVTINSGFTNIDVATENLTAGIYFLELTNETERITDKIIIK